jgi:hypothetical protein
MLAIFVTVLEMSIIVIRWAMCMKTMDKRDCGWQNNYNDVVEARTNSGTM